MLTTFPAGFHKENGNSSKATGKIWNIIKKKKEVQKEERQWQMRLCNYRENNKETRVVKYGQR